MARTKRRGVEDKPNPDGTAWESTLWWTQPKNDVHPIFWPMVTKLREQHTAHRQQCFKHLRLYGGKSTLAGVPAMQESYMADASTDEILSLDVTSGIVDAIHAKLTKNRPKPFVLSNDGSQTEQDRADGMGQFFQGAFYEHDIYEVAEECQLDSMIVGQGWVKVHSVHGQLCIDEVFDWEILIDNADGFYRNPRSLYQIKLYDKEVLLEKFRPGEDASDDEQTRFKDEIEPAILRSVSDTHEEIGRDSTVDQILVVEGWHLPSGSKYGEPTGGRHVICIQGCTLFDGEWTRKRFPFARITWKPKRIGARGTGVVEEIAPLQAGIYRLVDKLDEAHEALGKTFICVSGKTNLKQINNQITAIIVDGEVKFLTPQVVPPETYSHLQWMIQQAHERSGASMLSVTAQKPAGLDSGRALRTYHDIETERFSKQARRYERFVVDIAELLREEAALLPSDFAVTYVSQDCAQRIKWRDIASDNAVIQIFPTSFLSDTPAGRKQDVQDLIDLGVIQDPSEAKMFFDFPDVRSRLDPYVESYKYTMRQIDALLHEDETAMPLWAIRPEPHMNLTVAKQLSIAAYLKARRSDVDDSRCRLLREYMLAVVDEIKKLTAPAAVPGGGAPQGGPGIPGQAPQEATGANPGMPPVPAAA